MPFIDCQYQVIEPESHGSKDRKLIDTLKTHIAGSGRFDTKYVIMARDRSTLLKTLAFGAQRKDIHFLMTDIETFNEY